MAEDDRAKASATHTAFAMQRIGKNFAPSLEIGTGRIDPDDTVHVYLDRLPIGGFSGYVQLLPYLTEAASQRHGPADEGGDETVVEHGRFRGPSR
jgi:hypothetical protein